MISRNNFQVIQKFSKVHSVDGKDATLVLILEFLSLLKNREIIALEHTVERR